MLKTYLEEIFEPVIIFGFLTALLGIAAAYHYGSSNLTISVLIVVGVVLTQMAANLFDDYFDFSSGMDKQTAKTNFSGGSALIGRGKNKIHPTSVLAIGSAMLLVAAAIGFYFATTNFAILPILVVGAISAVFYSKYLSRIPLASEPLVVLNFTLVCFGAFLLIQGYANFYQVGFAFLPAGIMVGTALISNSVPDRHIDKKHGRQHAGVMLWENRRIGNYYMAFQLIAYVLVIAGVAYGYIPVVSLLVLITMPLSVYVFHGINTYKKPQTYEKYMGLHALSGTLFILILVAAFLI